jgi:hypothetical protein
MPPVFLGSAKDDSRKRYRPIFQIVMETSFLALKPHHVCPIVRDMLRHVNALFYVCSAMSERGY